MDLGSGKETPVDLHMRLVFILPIWLWFSRPCTPGHFETMVETMVVGIDAT